MGHVHAELMMEYAKDALETDKPWERWEYFNAYDRWVPLPATPTWYEDVAYRRKPRTININGHEVPEPVRGPLKDGEDYYFPDLFEAEMSISTYWNGDNSDYRLLKHGLIHITKDAAVAHAEALLSFTQKD